MTARPLEPLHDDPLSAEEREVAARLARLDAAAGPSAALDARILAAARSAATPRRPQPRWPRAVGACAVLVAAVGLAWQLKPMFALGPAPVSGGLPGAGTEIVVDVEPAPAAVAAPSAAAQVEVAAAPAAERADVVAPPPAPRARKAAPRPAPPAQAAASRAAAEARATALAEAAPASSERQALPAVAPAPAPPAPPPPPANVAESRYMFDESAAAQPTVDLDRITVSGSRLGRAGLPDLESDTRLTMSAWLTRIRERRDAGDIADARASLLRFRSAHPRVPVPDDLQPLLRDEQP
ncbi:hypothetical protein GCM10008101_14290 [Lysobacter xinjiangensis]|uniref:Meckel syndrome type 1 protein n=1 Tax=Cognatilysobacter xinjiangensis TaxID=546892 RepID=A0ABQ3BYB2_9GAMM|nr:hypothetical protein [Lysobacter xinjiangensis]GGZ61396.1 hypothetical protein GCM10008101_14290 [Lysobacter xinjiangensis]